MSSRARLVVLFISAPIVLLVVTGVLWGIAVWDAAASRRRAIL